MARSKMRTNRPEARRPKPALEHLEPRELLASAASALSFYHVQALPPRIGPGRGNTNPYVAHPVQTTSPAELDALDNRGKLITGKDRSGNEYVIAVHGPGEVIVTDVTPNDGVLADDLDTIQIVGADPRRTEVIGQVTASARSLTNGTTRFQRLVSLNGVKSVKLNGFTLTQTIQPPDGAPNYSNTGISLPGGVGLLQFHDIEGRFDTSTTNVPIRVVIGAEGTRLRTAPIIRIDNIFNTVGDSLVPSTPGVPQTAPTVEILVNGRIRHLDFLSAGAEPIIAGQQANFPTVSITGRTSILRRVDRPRPRHRVGQEHDVLEGPRHQSRHLRRPPEAGPGPIRRQRRCPGHLRRWPDPARRLPAGIGQPGGLGHLGHVARHAGGRPRLSRLRPARRRDHRDDDRRHRGGAGE